MRLLNARMAKVRARLLQPTASALEGALAQLSALENSLSSGERPPSPLDALTMSSELRGVALLALQARELYGEILTIESNQDAPSAPKSFTAELYG